MSSQKDNSGKSKLEELLNAGKSDASSLDDFEKEALEGFALLESDEKILDAKAELDARIYPALFTNKTTKRSLIIWYAAAGLFLMIGFGIYLVNTSTLTKEPELAQNNVSPKVEKTVSEPAVVSPPANEALSEPVKAVTLKPEFAHDLNPAKEKTEKQTIPAAKSGQSLSGIVSVEKNSAGISKTEEKADTDANSPDDNAKDLKSIPANEDIAAASTTTVNSSGAYAPSVQSNPTPIQISTIESSNTHERDIVEVTTKSLKKQESISRARVAKKAPSAPLIKCSYLGGETAFNKELGALLVKKGLDKGFSGTLVISLNKDVNLVKITKSDFNKKELKQVEQVLKTLKGFVLPTAVGNEQAFEYNFNYTPLPN